MSSTRGAACGRPRMPGEPFVDVSARFALAEGLIEVGRRGEADIRSPLWAAHVQRDYAAHEHLGIVDHDPLPGAPVGTEGVKLLDRRGFGLALDAAAQHAGRSLPSAGQAAPTCRG